MKSRPKLLLLFANGFIVLSILYYWFSTQLLNPIAIGLALIFGLHLFGAKGDAKLIFPTLFILLNLYMFLALFSEFNEFPRISYDALQLLFVGGVYLTLNVLSGIIMIRYRKEDTLNFTV